MGLHKKDLPKTLVLLQAGLVYAWLTVLSPLSVTDTYYSVYILCAVVGLLCLCDNYKGGYVCTKGQRWTIFAFSAFYAGAVALGNYELFEPLSVLQNLFDLACCLAGGLAIGYSILLCLLNRLPLALDPSPRVHRGGTFAAAFLSIAAIDLTYLFLVLYPGVLNTDSFSTIGQILGDIPYNNAMPFWHTVTAEPFVELGLALFGDINAGVALFHSVQILFMAACMGFAVVTLYQIGVPKLLLLAVWGIYAILPYNIVYSVTLWKDVPFAGAAILFVTALYRILKGVGQKKWINYSTLVVGILGFSLWRTNGFYAFAVVTAVMLPLLWKSHRKLLILLVVLLIVGWLLIGPVLDLLAVTDTNFVEAFAVPMQQIARVVAYDRELTQEETQLLGEIFWLDKVKELYDPLTVDPIKFETFRYYGEGEYILENMETYLSLYIRLGLKYPGDYLKAWVDETKGYWNGGYFFWTYTLILGENKYGIYQTRGEGVIAQAFGALFRYLEKPEILQCLTSIGLHTWALVTCLVLNVLKKRKEFLLTIPILVLIAGLWLGTPVYAEFRYAYPMILTMPVILLTTVYEKTE